MNLSFISNLINMNTQLNNKSMTNSLNKLSSGFKINNASDDASSLAIADKLRTHASGIQQAINNANSATALLQITDKSMAEISNILDVVKQKLIQAHTNTTSDEGRKTIKKDIEKLLSQIDNISEQTNYNGLTLLSHTGLDFQVGDNSSDIIHLNEIYTTIDGLSGVKLIDNSTNKNPGEIVNYSNINNYTSEIPFTSIDMTTSNNAYGITNPDLIVSPTNPLTTNKNDILTNFIGVSSTGNNVPVMDVNIEINTSNFKNLGTGLNWNINENSNISIPTGTYIYTDDDTTKKYFESYFIAIGRFGPQVQNEPIKFYNGNTLYIDFKGGGTPAMYEILNYDGNIDYDGSILRENINLKFKSVIYDNNIGTYFYLENVLVNKLEPLMLEPNNVLPINYGLSQINLPDIGTVDIINSWNTDINNLTPINDNNTENPCVTLKDLKNASADNFSFDCAGNFQSEVDKALTILTKYRSEVGSTQNQVESTLRNLMTDYVNTKNAESIIRDVDYSEETINFTKLNIISQAGSFAQTKSIESQKRILDLLK